MLGVVHPDKGHASRRPVPRREVLIGAGRGALGLAVLALTTTACSSEPPPDVDDLRAQLAAANSDSDLAQTLARDAPPAQAPVLTQIAGERTRHAQALAEEISRTLGTVVPPTPTADTPAPTTTTPPGGDTAQPTPPPTVADLAESLRAAADSAARYAARESGYRAGLLGSIAAACTAAYTVALPPARAAQ